MLKSAVSVTVAVLVMERKSGNIMAKLFMSDLAVCKSTTKLGPIGRGPVLFAGKSTEVLKQALIEANRSLKLY